MKFYSHLLQLRHFTPYHKIPKHESVNHQSHEDFCTNPCKSLNQCLVWIQFFQCEWSLTCSVLLYLSCFILCVPLQGRCSRENCKYLHPPPHLKTQLEINGRNNLIQQKNMAMLAQQMQLANAMIPGTQLPPMVRGHTCMNTPQLLPMVRPHTC